MKRVLYRSQDRVIAGVCSGIAAYYETDAQAIRILWALLTVFSLFIPGCIAYLVCWIIIKPAK